MLCSVKSSVLKNVKELANIFENFGKILLKKDMWNNTFPHCCSWKTRYLLNIELMIMGDSERLGMSLTQLYKDIPLKNYVNELTNTFIN